MRECTEPCAGPCKVISLNRVAEGASNSVMMRPIALALSVALGLPASALAQNQPTAPAKDELPVSLVRIKRALSQPAPSKSVDGLKISYYVSVTAENPPIDIFKDFDTKHGPVPGAAPTHAELFAHVTPQEFSAPAADLTAIIGWLGSSIYKKARHKD